METIEGEVASLRQRFELLKKDVIAFAASYGTIPDPGAITSLAALEPLLLAANKSLKEKAIQVLTQVRLIKHREQATFEPLKTCLSSASELQKAIEEVPLPDIHSEVEDLADGTHPLAAFLSLIRDHKEMKEEKIAEIQDVIVPPLGKVLFIAALMGKLIIEKQGGKAAAAGGQAVSETDSAAASETGGMPTAPPAPETVKAAEIKELPGESDEVVEQRQILQDLLTMTEMKIQRLLKNARIREEETAEFVAVMKKIEESRFRKSDFKEDFRQLQVIRATLEELENRSFTAAKR